MRWLIALALSSSCGLVATFANAQGIPEPKPVEPPPSKKIRFVADPVTDGAILSISIGFAGLLEVIIGTQELRPQQPAETNKLLGIDEEVVDDDPSRSWRTVSNIGFYTAAAYALGDTTYTGISEGTQSGLVDFVIYAESASITWALTNLAKIAVRRPRPGAYRERDEAEAKGSTNFEITDTNSALSFFSGHAAITAALSTTATYLAFSRSESSLRGYLTLASGTILTSAVAYGRVRGGAHFPTDVIAGAMAGVGVGALVPHIHREAELKQRPVWIGTGPDGSDYGLTLNALF
jgi:membrane-associated phospholipid phosphatase